MTDRPSHLTLVDPNSTHPEHDQEFVPLPYYAWETRPETLQLDPDECATAIHLAHGSLPRAAALLKVPEFRLKRIVKRSPRLQRILDESFELALDRAVAVPIDTLFDPNADARRLEWASTRLLQSRVAIGHPLSPAPASSTQTSVAINQQSREITFTWRAPSPPDIIPNDDD